MVFLVFRAERGDVRQRGRVDFVFSCALVFLFSSIERSCIDRAAVGPRVEAPLNLLLFFVTEMSGVYVQTCPCRAFFVVIWARFPLTPDIAADRSRCAHTRGTAVVVSHVLAPVAANKGALYHRCIVGRQEVPAFSDIHGAGECNTGASEDWLIRGRLLVTTAFASVVT